MSAPLNDTKLTANQASRPLTCNQAHWLAAACIQLMELLSHTFRALSL